MTTEVNTKNEKNEEYKNHITIGNELDLFFFDDVSPGSCFYLPHGTILLNNLLKLMRHLYKQYGYREVSTPVICDKQLWITSGHYEKYKENMFHIRQFEDQAEKESNLNQHEFSLCPMNCPKHIIMYKHMCPSYRDLPIRLADFGVLHRNEMSGALYGLVRTRAFNQDDAHIFCTQQQIEQEIDHVLEFLDRVYKIFGLSYEATLSTRPEKYIGEQDVWDRAETILKKCLERHVQSDQITVDNGGGAFYGPKIDILVKDSLNRKHQCGTIQLDFQLPQRFDMRYADSVGYSQPVMIHRAIFGSLGRFMAILLEHTDGHLPFFCSPRQVIILPVSSDPLSGHIKYANVVKDCINSRFPDVNVTIDNSDNTLPKRVVNADNLRYNYVIVIGKKELAQTNIINVRHNKVNQEVNIFDFLTTIGDELQIAF